MKYILSKLFWRIVLPFVLAFLLAIAQVMEIEGRLQMSFFPDRGSLYTTIPLFCILFGIGLRNTLRWAKEAEEYEVHLKEADEIEKKRRRRSAWIER